ncbi:MAG: hypothetical protein H0V53_13010 [Rubrobacter sp.]|nr:hypothetical protein [Rubrobacter sp.]
MEFSNKLMYVLLGLAVLMLVGMLASSWRVVLYSFLLVVGVSILFGFTRELPGRRPVLVAGSVVVLYGLLFAVLDVMTGGEPTGSTNYVLGMTPPMALYLLGFPVLVVITGVLYAVTFTQEDVDPELLERERAAIGGEESEGESR